MVVHIGLDFTNINSFMSIMFTHSSSLITSSVFLACAWMYLYVSVNMCVRCICDLLKLSVHK